MQVSAVFEELGNGAIDPDAGKPVDAQPCIDGRRPTELRQQQIGSPIVATRDHDVHEVGRGKATDRVVERPLPGIDLRKVGRRHSDLHRSEEHTSELQSLMRISFAVFGLKKQTKDTHTTTYYTQT